jgi:hypothetical protein
MDPKAYYRYQPHATSECKIHLSWDLHLRWFRFLRLFSNTPFSHPLIWWNNQPLLLNSKCVNNHVNFFNFCFRFFSKFWFYRIIFVQKKDNQEKWCSFSKAKTVLLYEFLKTFLMSLKSSFFTLFHSGN